MYTVSNNVTHQVQQMISSFTFANNYYLRNYINEEIICCTSCVKSFETVYIQLYK